MFSLRYRKPSFLFLDLGLLYILLSVLVPPDKASLIKYHITVDQDRGLLFLIIIPYLIIWFMAQLGYARLASYARSIRGSQDGRAFGLLAQGILWLALWLPLSAVISTATTAYYQVHSGATSFMLDINNYSTVVILLAGFWVLHAGSKRLLAVVRQSEKPLPRSVMIGFIAASALYVFMVLHDSARQFPTASVKVPAYALPDWLIVVTIIIPRLIGWFLGLQAIYNVYMYRQHLQAPIYKHALRNLARGLIWVIVSTVVLRCFQSLSTQIASLSLGLILLVILWLLILLSIGYVLIAMGAKRLQKIEEL